MNRVIYAVWEPAGLFLVFILMILYLYFFHMKKKKEKEKENKEYRAIIKRQKQYYDGMMEENMGIRKFRHDIKNQLFCLKRLLEDGNISGGLEYLQDLVGDFEKIGTKVETGNYILNIVAEDILKEEDNIMLEWEGRFPEKTKIRDIDLSILFANLLKNAKEEMMSMTDMAEKKITVTVKLLNGAVFVSCKNAVDKTRIRKKGEAGRGMGLAKVTEIVKRYNGDIKIEKCSEFAVQLLFYGIIL